MSLRAARVIATNHATVVCTDINLCMPLWAARVIWKSNAIESSSLGSLCVSLRAAKVIATNHATVVCADIKPLYAFGLPGLFGEVMQSNRVVSDQLESGA